MTLENWLAKLILALVLWNERKNLMGLWINWVFNLFQQMKWEEYPEFRWLKSYAIWRYPAKNVKENIDIYLFALTNIIITSFQNGFYPEMLKIAKVYPIFLKTDNLGKENCGPVILFFHICHRFLKDWCLNKTTITWHGDNLSLFFN